MSNEYHRLQLLSKEPDTHGIIAAYILKHLNRVSALNINDVARECYTSPSTIVRMCKKLGFSGFVDLKIFLGKYVSQWDFDEKESYKSGHVYENRQPSEIVDIMTKMTVSSIVDSIKHLEDKDISIIVDALYQSNRIDFYGSGASNIIAQDFQYKFLRAGKNCTAYSDQHIKFSQAQQSLPTTVAFGISYSGETKETIELLETAKARGATTIVLTTEEDNYLKQIADYHLIVKSAESIDGYVVASSRIAMLHIMDIIYSVYATSYKEEVVSNVARSRPVIAKDES